MLPICPESPAHTEANKMVDTSKRQTLIFGNGLGMALDPVGFRLETALEAAWNDSEALDAAAREAIVRCVPGDGDKGPRGEDELGDLQRALDACDTLIDLEGDGCDFLSSQGKGFPDAARRYIHRTACHFSELSRKVERPEPFFSVLASFLEETHSHVATLNYDQLLYNAFFAHGVIVTWSTKSVPVGSGQLGGRPRIRPVLHSRAMSGVAHGCNTRRTCRGLVGRFRPC